MRPGCFDSDGDGVAQTFNRSYSSTEMTITTARPCFSMSTGSARAVSIMSPKAFFAARADIVFMPDSRNDQIRH
jgi:hypothetical protein